MVNRLSPVLAIVLAAVSLAGCSDYPKSSSLVPLEFTYIRIGQDQYSTGVNPAYEGSLAYPHCLHNPNKQDLTAQNGYEIYQRLGPPNAGGARLIKKVDSGPDDFLAGLTALPSGAIHNVMLNETLEGNSTDYTIHLWNQILNPKPVHRVDRWFNMTFTPYGSSSTTHSEGEPCI
jgi:hypothetical protein